MQLTAMDYPEGLGQGGLLVPLSSLKFSGCALGSVVPHGQVSGPHTIHSDLLTNMAIEALAPEGMVKNI